MRPGRILFFIVIAVVAVAGFGAMGMRASRDKTSSVFEIKPGLYGARSGGGIYLFAARTGSTAVLFDTGADPGARPVDALLGPVGLGRANVHEIFLTHGHFDHIAGVISLPGAKVHLGLPDVGLAGGTTPPEALAVKVLALAMQPDPVRVTDPISDRQTIPIGEGKSVKAIPMPGHTPGSYAFLYDGVLFVGDSMIFKEGRLETTPALFDARPEENRAAIRSLKTQLVADPVETVCTAHGGCTPKGLGRNLLDDLISRVGG
jgi:glyoxylase-like metal-dependent hydrolase (beta-lactamase superfamily II)